MNYILHVGISSSPIVLLRLFSQLELPAPPRECLLKTLPSSWPSLNAPPGSIHDSLLLPPKLSLILFYVL